ncbi:MAG TPA: response regulator transcription factor [Pseudobacteroides sp.]|uniref:response regulator transcription factor n=1 Tax=Pseudobacteroides sp. TaxID=1968840 RepID=UPI002F93587E
MPDMLKILIIEDEEPIGELIRQNVILGGFDVITAADGKAGLDIIQNHKVDLVVLDLMLPQIDGYQLLPHIIDNGIPVIVLTARDSIMDKVKGLNLGADDFMTKPFEGVELLARIRSILRRAKKYSLESTKAEFDDITILFEQRKVLKGSEEISLTPKEFDLLRIVYENRGIALSREKLLNIVWDYDFEGNTRTVDMHIQKLREKLQTHRISTVYKFGYRMEL